MTNNLHFAQISDIHISALGDRYDMLVAHSLYHADTNFNIPAEVQIHTDTGLFIQGADGVKNIIAIDVTWKYIAYISSRYCCQNGLDADFYTQHHRR